MDFGAFYGNEALKTRLASAITQRKLPHSILISGPNGSGKHTLARLLCAAFECTGENAPCMKCSACRKVYAGTHPDVIVADDPEKKNVPVDLIRQTKADLYIRPNEGSRKIYIIPRAQDMMEPAQNALLKVMEEPPEYGVFLLLTDNPDKLLETIRSRCAHFALSPLSDGELSKRLSERFPDCDRKAMEAASLRSGGYLGQAIELLSEGSELLPQTQSFAEAYCAKDSLLLLQVLVPMEKLKRDQLLPILAQWYAVLENALTAKSGLPSAYPVSTKISKCRTSAELLRAVEALKKAQEQAQMNVGPGHICGALNVLLR